MRTIQLKNKYEGLVVIDDGKKIILRLHCTCYDFVNRQIHKVGKVSSIKYYSTPCKHLAKVFDAFVKQGYILRIPRPNEGVNKLTSKIRKAVYNE